MIAPAVMSRPPTMTLAVRGSRNIRQLRIIVNTTLSLSTGATRDTSPICMDLK